MVHSHKPTISFLEFAHGDLSDEDEEKSTTSEVEAVSAQEGAAPVIENSDSEDKND